MQRRKQKKPMVSNFSIVKNLSLISVVLSILAILVSVFWQAGRGLILLTYLSIELFLCGYKFFNVIKKG